MTPLGEIIFSHIKAGGPIDIGEYMRLCLGHPDHGYYITDHQTATGQTGAGPIGRAGDFITSPEISQMFGELIGLWCADHWHDRGLGDRMRLVELGPGRGTCMADALRAIAQAQPDAPAPCPHLVETSEGLRRIQAAALQGRDPTWHDRFDDVPKGPAIVIANEFFDALPVRQFQRCGPKCWRERLVDIDPIGRALVFRYGPPGDRPLELAGNRLQHYRDGDIVEISAETAAIAGSLARRIASQGGAALIVDYGYAAQPGAYAAGNTLQAVAEHQFADPLAAPGKADLTAHVDFEAFAAAARAGVAGAGEIEVWGPVNQGIFLQRLGIEARAASLSRDVGARERAAIETALRRFTGDDEMGRLFKVMALCASGGPVPAGFTEEDLK